MRILIANDDGIYSPGLAALAEVAREFGEVRIVAPDVEQSSAGQAISSARPVRYRRTQILEGIDAFRVNGTPADCVRDRNAHSGRRRRRAVRRSTSARTSATRRGTRARSRRRSRRRYSGARHRAQRAHQGRRAGFRLARALDPPRPRAAAQPSLAPARQRQLPARADRHPLDGTGRRPVRRPGSRKPGPNGSTASTG